MILEKLRALVQLNCFMFGILFTQNTMAIEGRRVLMNHNDTVVKYNENLIDRRPLNSKAKVKKNWIVNLGKKIRKFIIFVSSTFVLGMSSMLFISPIESSANPSDELDYKKRTDRHYKVSCLLYTSPSPRDRTRSRMPSSA